MSVVQTVSMPDHDSVYRHERPMRFLQSNFMIGEICIRVLLLSVWFVLRHTAPFVQVFGLRDQWADYAYPFAGVPRIPGRMLVGLSCGIPALVGCVCVWVVSVSMRRHTSKRFLFKELCYFALAASLALLLAGAVTNVVKIFTGRLRPDYLNRCFPSKFKKGQLPMIDLAQVVQSPTPKCEMYNYAVIDGRKSFPSGHSSYLAAVCVCSALYVHRVVQLVRLYRAKVSGRDADTPNPTASSLAARIVGLRVNLIDIFTSPGFTFCVCLSVATVIPAWAAASRITDRRHHPSDVFAGLLIGSVLGIVSFHLYFSRSHSFLNYPPAPSTKVFEALSSSAPPATTEATAPLTAKTL